jgi:hypothetical protein
MSVLDIAEGLKTFNIVPYCEAACWRPHMLCGGALVQVLHESQEERRHAAAQRGEQTVAAAAT